MIEFQFVFCKLTPLLHQRTIWLYNTVFG